MALPSLASATTRDVFASDTSDRRLASAGETFPSLIAVTLSSASAVFSNFLNACSLSASAVFSAVLNFSEMFFPSNLSFAWKSAYPAAVSMD